MTDTVFPDLIKYELFEVHSGALVDRSLEVDLCLQTLRDVTEAQLIRHLLELIILRLAHFDLNFIADAKLALNVL